MADQPSAQHLTIPPDPVIEAYKKDIDRTLLRENLKLTPEARLIKLEERMDRRFEAMDRLSGHGQARACPYEADSLRGCPYEPVATA